MGFMEKGTTMVAAIAVCVILILSVLVPVIADNDGAIEKKINLNNEGTPVVMGDPAGEYVIQWDSALPGMVKVNGNVTTVYFSAGADAMVSPTSKNVTTDLTYGELPIPVRTGYTFDGWYTSTSYTTEVTEDTVVTGTQDRTLYAKWVGTEYTVTFDAGSGTVSPATKTVTYGSAYGELPIPEYTGHIFGGWFDADDNPVSSASIVSIADNHTLHAVYTNEQYLISFTTDGNGTVDVQNVTVDYGTAYTISGNTIVIDGTTVTATGSYPFDSWTPATSGTVTGAMTFIANFVLPSVTISFAAQSPGTVDIASYTNVPRNTQYTVADNTVTIAGFGTVTASLPDGYYMTGWNVAQGVGTVTDAMTFTAQYEVIEIAKVVCSEYTTWVVTTDGKLFGCGDNDYGQQGSGDTTGVTTFTQRNMVGSVNIPVAIQPLNVPLNIPHLNFGPMIMPLSINASSMTGTDYTWLAGGEDWMLCTVSVGQNQYALALFYAGATDPLLWDEDVALTFSNGTLSGTNNGTPFTMTYTSIFYKGNGDYLLMTGDAYVMDDTNILGYAIPSAGNGLMVKGTITSLTAENIGGDITVGDAAVVSASTDYDSASMISEVSAAYNTDQTAVCSSVIVPKKVTVTETVEDGTMKAILSVIPLVLIVGLVLAIVGTFLYKRM